MRAFSFLPLLLFSSIAQAEMGPAKRYDTRNTLAEAAIFEDRGYYEDLQYTSRDYYFPDDHELNREFDDSDDLAARSHFVQVADTHNRELLDEPATVAARSTPGHHKTDEVPERERRKMWLRRRRRRRAALLAIRRPIHGDH
ncbi:hypothetical protein FA15DRAFT_664422 [Coprinopsis marcescibilis]|uniref:Secreted protein n=1 Tax=Coprinopsis marcescibilis TaxID=230819 RepID=A0A5C3L7V5_COPMA|nr:hypothetical protein FA15DRAFT_664422 [Coprinopsis marcescibilis]